MFPFSPIFWMNSGFEKKSYSFEIIPGITAALGAAALQECL
jgi:siroheme synthase